MIENSYIKYHDETYKYNINILNPSFYCVHKIVINDERNDEKRLKDSLSINNILKLIIKDERLKDDFRKAYNHLNKRQIKKFNKNVLILNITNEINIIL